MSLYGRSMGRLLADEGLEAAEAEELMGQVMDGELGPERVAALLTALAARGERRAELVGFARAMRARAVSIQAAPGAIDTCGTGGSGLSTVNTSTLVALTLAAAGVPVAKHGNRASSGTCGSSDVLEAAGVPVEVDPVVCEDLLGGCGIAFLHAPLFHPAMRVVGPVRRALGFRTVFNFLGPLCNPAGVRRQLLGVSSRRHAELMAGALAELGCERALVAWGTDGLDELSLAAPTELWFVEDGEVVPARVDPSSFGLDPVAPEAIAGGTPRQNLRIFEGLLDGQRGSHADHLALNAAAGLRVAGIVDDFVEGVELARELQSKGRLRSKFEAYREAVVGTGVGEA